MTILRSYTITNFDPVAGRIKVDITATDGSFTATSHTYYWLALDAYGNAPTAGSLTAVLNDHAVAVIPDDAFAQAKALNLNNGVANATTIDDLTGGIVINGGIPVVIYPDRAYNGNPSYNTFVRSTIISVGLEGTVPFDYTSYISALPSGAGGIDNGNVFGSGSGRSTISNIVQIGSTEAVQSVQITGSINGMWPIGQDVIDGNRLFPPQYVVNQYPEVFKETGGNYNIYYVEHTPLTITTNIAGGFFNYA